MSDRKQQTALRWWRGKRLDAVLALLVAIVSCGYVADAVAEHDKLSPIDEYVYIDYLYKFPDQGIVKRGEETGPEARDLIACKGVVLYLEPFAECGQAETERDELYPYGGGSAADIYTPLYFGSTWAGAYVVSEVADDELVDAGRVMGGVWLAAAAIVFLALLRRLQVERWLGFGLTLLLVVTPAVFWANSYVSTDAPAVLMGAVLGYLALGVARGETRARWLVLAAPLAVLLKIQFFAGVAFAALFLLIVAGMQVPWVRRRDGIAATLRDPRARAGLAALAAGGAAQVAWMVVRAQWNVGPSVDQGIHGQPQLAGVIAEAFRFLGGAALAPVTMGTERDTVGTLVSWLCIAGVIGVALAGRIHAPARSALPADGSPVGASTVADSSQDESSVAILQEGRAWGSAALLTGVVAGPALSVAAAFVGGAAFGLPPRYGLVLVPLFLASFALLVPRNRAFGYVATAIGVVAVILSFTQDYVA